MGKSLSFFDGFAGAIVQVAQARGLTLPGLGGFWLLGLAGCDSLGLDIRSRLAGNSRVDPALDRRALNDSFCASRSAMRMSLEGGMKVPISRSAGIFRR
ncbi:MAG: hypothetical protein ACT4QA_07855 [Panacagrimonas sp.]